MELEIVRADGSVTVETIRTTDEHPWKSGDAWLRTDQLSIGTGIVTLSRAAARVRAVSATGQREATYNFEVAEFHTYFVGQGGYWVHNACITTITNITTRGTRAPNLRLSTTVDEFVSNLTTSGFAQRAG